MRNYRNELNLRNNKDIDFSSEPTLSQEDFGPLIEQNPGLSQKAIQNYKQNWGFVRRIFAR